MKIIEINAMNFGSTGFIMENIAQTANAQGNEVCCMFPLRNGYPELKRHDLVIRGKQSVRLNGYVEKLFGLNDCLSYFSTKRMIRRMKRIKPDIIHLHVIHGSYLNLKLLFNYLSSSNTKVIWTLHDCWSFTGHCPYFLLAKCEKWKDECHHCPVPRIYPKMYIDTSRMMYHLKQKYFNSVTDMTLVTPSAWLANLTRQSFLHKYPVKVINNGINLEIFKQRDNDFRERNGITDDQYVVLGIAFGWGERKGFDVFMKLANELDSNYKIVLVGTDETIDEIIPKNVISIHRTNNQQELAEIYSAADVFANPTREDNFPTTNLEALACGTPVVTFDTGGSPEAIDESCGIVVPCDDLDAFHKSIIFVCENKRFSSDDCRRRAMKFDMNDRFLEYVDLFAEVKERKNENSTYCT